MSYEVYLDNIFIGYVEDYEDFIRDFKEKRRSGIIPEFVNISLDEDRKIVEINTRKGRILRPLIVVKDKKPLLTKEDIEKLSRGELSWSDLEKMGVIEWVDPEEEENLKVALYPEDIKDDTTHLEVSSLIIFGIATSLNPFSNKNQSARLNRGVRPLKQSHAIYSLNYHNRFDTDISILYYPQQPIVRTFSNKIFQKENLIGQNVVVAVMTQDGYNIEDALIMSKSSIERGIFRSVYFRSYEVEKLRYPGGLQDEIGIPDPSIELYRGKDKYKYLEEDGIVSLESYVSADDVIVGRTSPPRFLGLSSESITTGLRKKDSSLTMGGGEEGYVDSVVVTESPDGNTLIKIRVRDLRIPELGDKFTVRHGQKGVIGMIVEGTDVPWSSSGIRPDIIFSPAGIPSRETFGLLLELLGGKVGSLNGRYVDGTPWYGEDEEELRKELLSLGFKDDGTETLYNPITGDEFKAKIFIGSLYYLRLKYMAKNKLQARATGPITLLTKQPTEGKSKKGGLRFSEMENEVLAAHGSSILLREMFSSDDSVIFVCESCGSLATEDNIRNRLYCPVCGETEKISKVKVSYGFTLLLKELISIGIWPRLKLDYKF
ncbi:DNA-directed RNA polymerase subunit B' [Nanobdella aerobiophila]|uniref:DNA-directed RNA polymerase n=1 Tax=Nanobdella aerobiophila TaxID=2586965 RepID=A0A915WSH1_9ARCH|nr:DNA-directed RNA polymerase subunit B [Nanobdella aerobiophila]BBL45295.1 DNA-directed RNA polymerase subunit B' [Nanobdella aerobiophila]